MLPKMALFTLMLALPAFAAETAPAAGSTEPQAVAGPLEFAEAMDGCTEARFEAPHPFAKGFIIEHRIIGKSDEACNYSQSMPGGMRMECALTDEGRAALAEEFRVQASGRMSGSTARQPVWTQDCRILDKDGKATPMQGG